MTSVFKVIDDHTRLVTITLGKEELADYMKRAEESLARSITIAGFRRGKVPADVARKHMSEHALREEALQLAVHQSLREAIEREGIDVHEQKDFTLIKNTADTLEFSVTLTLYPSVVLGEYRGIEVTKEPQAVSDSEVETVAAELAKTFPAETINRDSIRDGLLMEKQERENMRVRLEILKKIVAQSTITAPQSWSEEERQALVLHAIARAENIEIGSEEVGEALELEVERYLVRRPGAGADPLKDIDLERAKNTIALALLNNKVFAFLESHAILHE